MNLQAQTRDAVTLTDQTLEIENIEPVTSEFGNISITADEVVPGRFFYTAVLGEFARTAQVRDNAAEGVLRDARAARNFWE